MKIAIGADHSGFLLKEKLIGFLESKGHVVADMGTHNADSCDYPVYAEKVARAAASKEFDRGVLICKSGIGMSMAANKVQGSRAALCIDIKSAKLSREHNDANVICFSAAKASLKLSQKMLDVWLNTDFAGGRHLRRVNLMAKIEKNCCGKGF